MEEIIVVSELAGIHDGNNASMISMRAKLFGHMVKLSQPLLQHYHSDLYHDAIQIAKTEWSNIFYYAANDCGTDIFTDETLINDLYTRENVWRIELGMTPYNNFAMFMGDYHESFRFTIVITKVREPT